MARPVRSVSCVLLAPTSAEFESVSRVVRAAARDSAVRLSSLDDSSPFTSVDLLLRELLSADAVVAVASSSAPNVLIGVGLALAADKPLLILVDEGSAIPPFVESAIRTIAYGKDARELTKLHSRLLRFFEELRRNPERVTTNKAALLRAQDSPVIDFDRLDPREFENLCFELLVQIGFRDVEWARHMEELDLIATLPKRDPDGFDYHELWLISAGLRAPPDFLLNMASQDPAQLIGRLKESGVGRRVADMSSLETSVTLLLILIHDLPLRDALTNQIRKIERMAERRSSAPMRVRVWDRHQLSMLIQRHPHIARKYFSDESRTQSGSRKSYEQLYKENIILSTESQATVAALKEERDKRARAERDAVWKDVAFTAAHKLGNPIFALETNLLGLKRRIPSASREALEITSEITDTVRLLTLCNIYAALSERRPYKPPALE